MAMTLVQKALQSLVSQYGLSVSGVTVEDIAVTAQGDIRTAVNALQFTAQGTGAWVLILSSPLHDDVRCMLQLKTLFPTFNYFPSDVESQNKFDYFYRNNDRQVKHKFKHDCERGWGRGSYIIFQQST